MTERLLPTEPELTAAYAHELRLEIARLQEEVRRLNAQNANLERLLSEGRGSLKELADIKYALDTSNIVAMTDRRGVITYVNDYFCEISGYSRDELLGRTHQVVNSGYHPKTFFQDLWATIRKGQVWQDEIRNRKKTGDFYWVHTTIVPFLDESGQPYQYVSIRSDITKRKSAENQLRETREALMMQTLFAQRLSALAALTGGIAHELNQPLSSIRVYAETVQNLAGRQGQLPPERAGQTMGKIIAQVDRASRVIMHMREFASEQTDTATAPLDLRELIEHVLEFSGEQLRAHGITFVNDIPAGQLVLANHSRMEQVLINLISNAKDSIDDKAGGAKEIRVSSQDDGEHRVLAIRDTGGGIPESVRHMIFEPFVTTKGPDRGTGLGLSICLGILRDYHASIHLVQTSDQGTEFHLKFPLPAKE